MLDLGQITCLHDAITHQEHMPNLLQPRILQLRPHVLPSTCMH
jgi:hypothetical protein